MSDDLTRLLLLQDANTRTVLLGASLLGLTSGVIGTFAVLRRRALLGDALAHAALPGLCMAYFVVGVRSLPAFLLGALVFGTLGVLCVSFIRAATRIKEDAAIGLVLSTFFGLGIVLSRIIQNQPAGHRAGLDTYIYGKAAAMVQSDVALIGCVALFVLFGVALLFKEFGALSFDREFLAVQGRPVFFLDVLMMALLCVCTIIGLPAVGVVLMAALLIIPAAAARFWTERLAYMVLISGGIGFFSALVGTAISALAARFPAGPLVVLTASACFVGSVLFAPRRGVIARLWRRRALSRRVEMQNVLRAMFEVGDSGGTFSSPAALEQLLRMRAWRAPALLRCLERTAARGLLRTVADGYVLTDTGLIEARKVVRAHRLWEQYLIEHADVAPDHVDRDADQIEHILPQELIHRLEERLRADGRLPQALPESPHRLGEATP